MAVETEELVAASLAAMRANLKQSPAWSKAPPPTDDFLLMFLRSEVFKPHKAADRYRKYWKVCILVCIVVLFSLLLLLPLLRLLLLPLVVLVVGWSCCCYDTNAVVVLSIRMLFHCRRPDSRCGGSWTCLPHKESIYI